MQVKNPPKVANFLSSAAGQKFLKLVGLLGSDHDGERSNASGMANRLLREADLTWGEVMGQSGAADDGLHKLLMADMQQKLRIAQELLEKERKAHRLTASNLTLAVNVKTGTQGLNQTMAQKIARLEAELKAFKSAANGPGTAGPPPPRHNPNMYHRDYSKGEEPAKDAHRKYANAFQKGINEIVDAIESNLMTNDWEQQFLTSIRDLKFRITQKQVDKLTALAKQAGVEIEIEYDQKNNTYTAKSPSAG